MAPRTSSLMRDTDGSISTRVLRRAPANTNAQPRSNAADSVTEPLRPESNLVVKGGILVIRGSDQNSDHINWDSLVDDEREERIRKIMEF